MHPLLHKKVTSYSNSVRPLHVTSSNNIWRHQFTNTGEWPLFEPCILPVNSGYINSTIFYYMHDTYGHPQMLIWNVKKSYRMTSKLGSLSFKQYTFSFPAYDIVILIHSHFLQISILFSPFLFSNPLQYNFHLFKFFS